MQTNQSIPKAEPCLTKTLLIVVMQGRSTRTTSDPDEVQPEASPSQSPPMLMTKAVTPQVECLLQASREVLIDHGACLLHPFLAAVPGVTKASSE